jgi:SAM-dependent methyltransferase
MPPNLVSGWALQHDHPEPLPIKVFAGDRLLGEGTTGRARPSPPGNCGFVVVLSQPIELSDLRARTVRAYAVSADGRLNPLRVWQKLVPPDWAPERRTDEPLGRREIERLIATRSIEVARPYVSRGQLLPPVCIAAQLRSSIEEGGLRGFVPDMGVPAVLECLERDHLPIPAPENRENYAPHDDALYWLLGFDDFHKVARAIQRCGIMQRRILDFGGATGRVFRHFATQTQFDEIYACDFNWMNVDWCKANFPPLFKIFLNSALPTLPFPDNFLDVITAFSVFTHIDEFEDTWLLELLRILRPGGLAYLTVADEHTWERLPPHRQKILRAAPEAAGIDFSAAMPFDRQVFTHTPGTNYSCDVFQSQKYIKRSWGRYFTIEAFEPLGHANLQSAVIAQK